MICSSNIICLSSKDAIKLGNHMYVTLIKPSMFDPNRSIDCARNFIFPVEVGYSFGGAGTTAHYHKLFYDCFYFPNNSGVIELIHPTKTIKRNLKLALIPPGIIFKIVSKSHFFFCKYLPNTLNNQKNLYNEKVLYNKSCILKSQTNEPFLAKCFPRHSVETNFYDLNDKLQLKMMVTSYINMKLKEFYPTSKKTLVFTNNNSLVRIKNSQVRGSCIILMSEKIPIEVKGNFAVFSIINNES